MAAGTRARNVADTMLASLSLKGGKDYGSKTKALLVCCQLSLPKRGDLSALFLFYSESTLRCSDAYQTFLRAVLVSKHTCYFPHLVFCRVSDMN